MTNDTNNNIRPGDMVVQTIPDTEIHLIGLVCDVSADGYATVEWDKVPDASTWDDTVLTTEPTHTLVRL